MQIRNSRWLAIFTVLGFVSFVATPPVSGVLRVNPKTSSMRIPAKLQLLAKVNGQVAGKAFPDSSGRFQLSLPPVKDSLFDVFCVAPGLDTLFLRSVPAAATALPLLFPCEPDTTASGEIVCPKCRREDQVYPMLYGDPIVITRHYDTTGKVSYERTPGKEPQTDSVVRAARYYCRRDRITF